jgi:3-oxoacyl-[acyl-carrier-protein] synthase-1
MTPRQIVFTGTGAICGAGHNPKEIWQTLLSGQSSIGPLTRWDPTTWSVKQAAEITGITPRQLVEDRRLHKMLSRSDLYGLYAAGCAVQESNLPAHRDMLSPEAATLFNDRSGVFAGSGGAAYSHNYDFLPAIAEAQGSLHKFGTEHSTLVDPLWLLRHLPNNVVCHVGIRFGFKGTNACITNQCAGGLLAVIEAAEAIRNHETDRATATGHDSPLDAETFLHYQNLGLLSPDTLRPFDTQRSGTIFGEGAASVVLETAEDARQRNTPILGEYLGSGCTTEATGVVEIRPDGDGPARAIQLALENANLSPDDIGLIVAHGNGTRTSDASEAAAIQSIWPHNPPPITAFKWAFGHLIAAAGTMDLVLTLLALQQNTVPAITPTCEIDPAFNHLPITTQSTQPRSNTAIVLCRGFGGMNVAVAVRAGTPAAAS